MVDASLYREGEVKRFSGAFGDWLVVCDEIRRLRQRSCSLNTIIRSPPNQAIGNVDVSTGDDGQPAALIHIPLGVVIPYGIEISFVGQKQVQNNWALRTGKEPIKVRVASKRRLPLTACDPSQCLALWDITAAEIGELRRGNRLALHFVMSQAPSSLPIALAPKEIFQSVDVFISPDGFTSAISASLK